MDDPASYLAFWLLLEVESLSISGVLLRLLAVAIIVAFNAFFVISEFALVTVRRTRLEARAAAGNKSAQAALRLVNNPSLFISAVQMGVTVSSLALGWVGEPTVAAILQPLAAQIASEGTFSYISQLVSFALAFSVITFLTIVFGELVPKMIALEKSEQVALIIARPLQVFARIFKAPIWLFNTAGTAVGRLLGLKATPEQASVYTEAELRQLIDIARESGHLRAEERRLIHRVFEFSDTLVREAKVPRTEMAAIPSTSSLEEIAKAFDEHGYSRLPVYRDSLDNVLGFIHSKDIMRYLTKPESFKLEDVLQAPLYVVDTARLEDVLRQMQKAKSHFGFVVDEHGGLEGIITLEDLLEEIVGDISDEHDEEVNEQITPAGERKFILAGGLAVRDLNRRLKLNIPESEQYTTIAGFLMTAAGHLLKQGEIVRHNGLLFQIERVERRRVIRVRLELQEEQEQQITAADNTVSAAG